MEGLESLSTFTNNVLCNDIFACRHLPILNPEELLEKLGDGLIFARLINIYRPGTLDETLLGTSVVIEDMQKKENMKLVCEAMENLGCILNEIDTQGALLGRLVTVTMSSYT